MAHARTVDVITSDSPAAQPDPEARSRPWGEVIGATATGLAVVLLALLHLCGSDIHPVRDRLGDYLLGSYRRVFDTAVLALATGSACLLHPALLGRARATVTTVCYGCSCLGLVAYAILPRDPLGAPVSLIGAIHRYAAVLALVGLPLGALLTARRHPAGGGERAIWLLACGCLVALAPLALAYLGRSPLGPFVGLVERAVVLGEVVLLLLAGRLAHRGRSADGFAGPIRAPGPTPGAAGSRRRQPTGMG